MPRMVGPEYTRPLPPKRETKLDRIYPLVLCCCRFILSATQFSVALETYVALNALDRTGGANFPNSLAEIADSNVDYTWVPVMPRDTGTQDTYGNNKLFNYFIIRFLHFLRQQVADFTLYPAAITFGFMVALSAYDLFEIYQKRFNKATVRKVGFWMQTCFYAASVMLICLQAVILLFENGNTSHMEVVYPFLFAFGASEKSAHPMLLKTGARSLKRRLIACVIFNMGSLVPDTYLLLVRTLQPLRLYVIVNAMKVASGMLVLGAFVMGCILRYYMTAALDPKLLADKASLSILQHNPLVNVKDHYPRTGWATDNTIPNSAYIKDDVTYLPVFDMSLNVSARVKRTVEKLQRVGAYQTQAPDFIDKIKDLNRTDESLAFQKDLAVYGFVQLSYGHIRTIIDTFIYMSIFMAISSLALGGYGFMMVVKRHKLLLYINVLTDMIAAALQLCNLLLIKYPVDGADFFCEIKEYIPATSGSTFESMALYAWMCRAKALFTLVMSSVITQALLFLADLVLLYMLWR